MRMIRRKQMTEIAVSLPSQGTLLVHPKDLVMIDGLPDDLRELAEECHVYIIGKRPRLRFVPGSIRVGEGRTEGVMEYSEGGFWLPIKFAMEGELSLELVYSPFPHRTIDLIRDEKVVHTLPAYLMPSLFAWTDTPAVRNLEVVYVGMAYGDGSRSAKDRLKGHATLQQVLADISADDPESEAMIVMVQYDDPIAIFQFDSDGGSLDDAPDRDPVADLEAIGSGLGRRVEICLAEAGLIRYFQPKYNEKYKNHFPSSAHSITKRLYDIDIAGLSVEINTEDLDIRLYSHVRPHGYHHIATYDLHDPSERRSFYAFLESSSSYRAENFSGPVF